MVLCAWFWLFVLLLLLVLAGLPWLVYVCVKLATVAYLRGRQVFFETFDKDKETSRNGERQRRST